MGCIVYVILFFCFFCVCKFRDVGVCCLVVLRFDFGYYWWGKFWVMLIVVFIFVGIYIIYLEEYN